jgi:hypothetical protein
MRLPRVQWSSSAAAFRPGIVGRQFLETPQGDVGVSARRKQFFRPGRNFAWFTAVPCQAMSGRPREPADLVLAAGITEFACWEKTAKLTP